MMVMVAYLEGLNQNEDVIHAYSQHQKGYYLNDDECSRDEHIAVNANGCSYR